jgi:uncharacterized membrane protein
LRCSVTLQQGAEHEVKGARSYGRIARGTIGVTLVLAYEVGSHHAVSTPGMHGIGLALAVAPVMMLSLGIAARSARRMWLVPIGALCVLAASALWMARGALARHFEWGLFLEHVAFNLAMAAVFGRTLFHGREPLCSRFAAMVQGPLTPPVATYTRRITAAWAVFFVMVAVMSTVLFASASLESWSTFANYLTLPLVAAMFVAEYGCRRLVLPHMAHSGILEGVRAYRQSMHERAAEPQ